MQRKREMERGRVSTKQTGRQTGRQAGRGAGGTASRKTQTGNAEGSRGNVDNTDCGGVGGCGRAVAENVTAGQCVVSDLAVVAVKG
jgi:hypothetical protein